MSMEAELSMAAAGAAGAAGDTDLGGGTVAGLAGSGLGTEAGVSTVDDPMPPSNFKGGLT